jgi:hypothetical protein
MSDASLHRRPRLLRVALWTTTVVLLAMAWMAGMPHLGLAIAEHAPGLLRLKALFYSPAAYTAVLGLGAIIAIAWSWARNRSILPSVFAGLLSWGAVAYFACTRKVRDYPERERRDRIAWRVAISIAVCGVALGWYVLAWVSVARGLNRGTIASQRQPYFQAIFAPLISYSDSTWPGSVSLTNMYYVVNPISASGYALAPNYHGIRTSLPEPPPPRPDRRPVPPVTVNADSPADSSGTDAAAPRDARNP